MDAVLPNAVVAQLVDVTTLRCAAVISGKRLKVAVRVARGAPEIRRAEDVA